MYDWSGFMIVKKSFYLLLYHWSFAKAYYYNKKRHYKRCEYYEQKLTELDKKNGKSFARFFSIFAKRRKRSSDNS